MRHPEHLAATSRRRARRRPHRVAGTGARRSRPQVVKDVAPQEPVRSADSHTRTITPAVGHLDVHLEPRSELLPGKHVVRAPLHGRHQAAQPFCASWPTVENHVTNASRSRSGSRGSARDRAEADTPRGIPAAIGNRWRLRSAQGRRGRLASPRARPAARTDTAAGRCTAVTMANAADLERGPPRLRAHHQGAGAAQGARTWQSIVAWPQRRAASVPGASSARVCG